MDAGRREQKSLRLLPKRALTAVLLFLAVYYGGEKYFRKEIKVTLDTFQNSITLYYRPVIRKAL